MRCNRRLQLCKIQADRAKTPRRVNDREQRRELRAELIETLTQIVHLRPRVDLRPNVYRLEALALHEILADQSGDPEEAAHREWLKRRMEAETEKVAFIPTRLETRPRRKHP